MAEVRLHGVKADQIVQLDVWDDPRTDDDLHDE